MPEKPSHDAILEKKSEAMEASIDGLAILDSNETYIYLNSAHARIYGYDAAHELMHQTWRVLYDEDECDRFENQIMPELWRLGRWRGEATGKKKDGTLFPQEVSLTKLEEGGLICVVRDLSDQKKAERAILESERRFQRMLQVVPDMISIHSTQMDILYSNWKGFAAVAEEKRIPGTKCYRTYRGFDDVCPDCRAKSVLDDGKPLQKEIRLPDDTWFDMRVIPLLDRDHNVEMFMEWVRDITDRKRTEAALQRQLRFEQGVASASACLLRPQDPYANVTEALGHLCLAAEVSRVYIFENFLDPADGLCLRQTHEACAPGIEPEIDNPDLQHVPYAAGFERWRKNLSAGKAVKGHVADFPDDEREILESQDIVSLLVLPLSAGGKWRGLIGFDETRQLREWLEAEISLLGTAADLIGGYLALIDAQEAQRASEEKFAKAFHTSPYVITISRVSDGSFIEANEAFTTLTGYTRQEAFADAGIGLKLWADPDDRERVIEKLKRGEAVIGRECRFVSRSGRLIDGLFSGQLIRLDGELCMLASVNDITEQTRAREERQRLHNQLAQARKMESVGRLAGGVAHDFNNMLSVILGYTELALEQARPNRPLHAALQEIQKAAQRSADVTRQLLAFARKQTIAPKVLDLNETLTRMLKMLRRLIGEDIDLVWLPSADLWPVRVDPSQIDQILANLCVNARDAIAGVGKITIETHNAVFDEAYCVDHPGFVPGDFVLMAVSDDGCGMDEETLGNLFEPFFTTKGVDRGTGLGLATVYGIIKQNSGFINVYSEKGEGTTFKIYLPRHEAAEAPLENQAPAAPDERGSETVLLVEDESLILDMTRMMLERLGYTVLTAVSPKEAVTLAREHAGEIHLLMTDVVMPEMNGRELAQRLLSLYPDIRCLFMSGYTANVIAHHGVLDPGVHFIQKPFSISEMSAKLREALRGAEGAEDG